jgi:hypothetical protein
VILDARKIFLNTKSPSAFFRLAASANFCDYCVYWSLTVFTSKQLYYYHKGKIRLSNNRKIIYYLPINKKSAEISHRRRRTITVEKEQSRWDLVRFASSRCDSLPAGLPFVSQVRFASSTMRRDARAIKTLGVRLANQGITLEEW